MQERREKIRAPQKADQFSVVKHWTAGSANLALTVPFTQRTGGSIDIGQATFA